MSLNLFKPAALGSCCLLLAACGTPVRAPSEQHLKAEPAAVGEIPQIVQQSPSLAVPRATPKVETYSVSVYKVQAQSLLFALARDAKLNIDVHPGIQGEVTLNALDQSLPQLLKRVARQVDMRYELDGSNLTVLPDTPFLRNYKIDYVNIERDSSSRLSVSNDVAGGGSGTAASASSSSTAEVRNTSNNRFWSVLKKNIEDLLHETDKVVAEAGAANQNAAAPAAPAVPVNPLAALLGGAAAAAPAAPAPGAPAPASAAPATPGAAVAAKSVYREAASVISNPETGLLAVRATGRQHEKIQEFLDMVVASARRQVVIEATIVEVQLGDQYQQGINWSRVSNGLRSASKVAQGQVGTLSSGVNPGNSAGMFVMNFLNSSSALGDISATVQLLESFGKVKVLSSPKISVLNNQTAMLKVVDNNIYFTVTADITPATKETVEKIIYTSTLHTVPVGFVMGVTPQISDTDEVTLNVRPTISRVVSYVQDPNPVLAAAKTTSVVPVVASRELESILRVNSGQTAMMGGLMQDTVDNAVDAVPAASQLPWIGKLFSYRNEKTTKSELVVFIRPVVVKNASLEGDFKQYRSLLDETKSLDLVRPATGDGKAGGR